MVKYLITNQLVPQTGHAMLMISVSSKYKAERNVIEPRQYRMKKNGTQSEY